MGPYPTHRDRDLVAAMRNESLASAAAVYDRFGGGMFAYACGFLDPSSASDVVHDSVWIAIARIRALRNPDLLRAWLYAIVRAECMRSLAESGTGAGFRLVADPTVASEPDVVAVHEVAERLHPKGREVVDLAIRHRFGSHELAAMLGAATGDGRLLAHARDFVDRSVPEVPNALGVFALLPLIRLPHHLRARLLAVPPAESELFDMGRRADPLDGDGFPRPNRRPKRGLPVVAASIAVLGVLGAGAALFFPETDAVGPSGARPAVDLNLDIEAGLPARVPASTSEPTVASSETSTQFPAVTAE